MTTAQPFTTVPTTTKNENKLGFKLFKAIPLSDQTRRGSLAATK
ncbi:hypothetical protein NQ317_006600 [Molorchus minor]|uniref:Photosystem II subunit H n=1 Tax=Molorchus minor TaxID=1323400 RepID=A0ABQ9K227_9CUCU|nr:hypothetical protein NQ317_006600 [Molorchus minor]